MINKRYKYTGTPEQLEEFGYEVNNECATKEVDEDIDETVIELYIPLETANEAWFFQQGMISFNNHKHDYEFDVKDYIQDLIDAGLIEVLG